MLRLFRNRRFLKGFSAYVILHLLTDWISPQMVHALTSGPSTPEFSSFEPVGTSELVNVSTGDFVYNIPLMDVEGYPINLAYHSGVGMDQEASMVGLGWSLNLGAINRNVRGIPDDFKGDEIRHEFSMKPNSTVGVNLKPGLEFLGLEVTKKITPTVGITYNSYQGYGTSFGYGFGGAISKGPLSGLTYGLSLSYSSSAGLGYSPSLGFNEKTSHEFFGYLVNRSSSISVGASFNSRMGLQSLSLGSESSWQSKRVLDGGLTVKKGGGSSHAGGAITFSSPSYSPLPSNPYLQYSSSFYFTLGAEGLYADAHGGIGGNVSIQDWLDKKRIRKAYGYLYADLRSSSLGALADFNREKDNAYIPGATRNLPLAQQTFDTYAVTGQGLIGQFRPRRNDIGVVSDPFVANLSASSSSSGQTAGGGFFDLGGNILLNSSTSSSGKWSKLYGNQLLDEVDFVNRESVSDPIYEPVYFKQVGELTPVVDEEFVNSIGGVRAVRPELSRSVGVSPPFLESLPVNISPKTGTQVIDRNGNLYTPEQRKEIRDVRNTLFSSLTVAEAAQYGLTKNITFYDTPYSLNGTIDDYYSNGQINQTSQSVLPRNNGDRKEHHVSEITVTRPDGARYVYGVPAYNWRLLESTFNISGNSQYCEAGLAAFEPGVDNSIDNKLGLDYFYSSTETPAYPYAHLLSSVLSTDYVDSDGIEGPSDGDLGSWHKMNYWRSSGNSGWRAPLGEDYISGGDSYVNLNRGYLSDDLDDKGSYTYGEKEIFFVHSIESQHYVALFEYEDRQDNYTVEGEYGAISSSQPNKKLIGIKLFAKEELKQESLGNGTAIPIKSVHFSYDYLLCPNTPNASNNSGLPPSERNRKLTLTELSFSYGTSSEAKLSPYKFYYSDVFHSKPSDVNGYQSISPYNPGFHSKAYDRWGNYSPPCTNFNGCDCDQGLGNDEFPYVNQNFLASTDPLYVFPEDRYADAYARVWNLHTILTPSGAQIDIDYEADDYAYVQDRSALQMCKIDGFGESTVADPDFLYGESSNYNNLILTLPENFSFPSWANTLQEREAYFKEVMLETLKGPDGNWLYLSVYTNLNRHKTVDHDPALFPAQFEYVPCWVEMDIDQSGLVNNGGIPTQAYIYIVPQGAKDHGGGLEIQAVAKNAINYLRLNRPQYVTNPGSNPSPTQLSEKAFLKGLVGLTNDLFTLAKGYNRAMYKRNYGREIVPSRSWVRLGVPDKMKHGGGCRVKQITLHDQWAEMAGSNQESHSYGQEYDYTKTETLNNGEERIVSSGVAAYEPIIGGDENPFRRPRIVSQHFLAANDQRHFLLEPMGESFFPGPQVIYSRVAVSTVGHEEISKHGTGKIVHEFYTSKDYPTIVNETKLKDIDAFPNPITNFYKFLHTEGSTVSQGYVVRRNNMHGKPKAQWVYGEGQEEPLSGVEYFYSTKGQQGYQVDTRNELNNSNIPVLGSDGKQTTATIGQEIDLVFDTKGIQSRTVGADFRTNVNTSIFPFAFPVPLPIPNLFVIPKESRSFFRSMVATKVVDSYGILESVIAHDLGASVATENHLWDGKTGNVLMTKSYNEYRDPRFQTTYPAHWVYNEVGQAYQNHKATFKNINLNSLLLTEAEIFAPGDEVFWANPTLGASGIAWILDVGPNAVTMIDESGTIVDTDPGSGPPSKFVEELVIFRSGKRNVSMTPVAGLVTEQEPIKETNPGEFILSPDKYDDVLNSGATTLRDNLVSTPNLPALGIDCDNSNPLFSIHNESGAITDCLDEAEIVNPYYVGIKGTWVQDNAYAFLAERKSVTDLRKSGFLAEFSSFWLPPGNVLSDWSSNPANWTFSLKPTLVSVHSGVLESVDPLNIYSSVQFGYGRKLPTAQVSNSKYSWMGFDGFEDYSLESNCSYRHWPLWVATLGRYDGLSPIEFISETESHSGKRSVLLQGNAKLFSIQEFGDGSCLSGANNTAGEYALGTCDFQPYFNPEVIGSSSSPEKFILSFWVKNQVNSSSPIEEDIENIDVRIGQCSSSTSGCNNEILVTSRSPILDGWQRVEYVIDLNNDFCTSSLGAKWMLSIENTNSQDQIFIDDIRIHPVNSIMNTYVYDSENLRLLAVGDANNFTRFYQYNPKGELVSVMVETEEGIKSVEEARYNTSK